MTQKDGSHGILEERAKSETAGKEEIQRIDSGQTLCNNFAHCLLAFTSPRIFFFYKTHQNYATLYMPSWIHSRR